jgi:hypothetical protein
MISNLLRYFQSCCMQGIQNRLGIVSGLFAAELGSVPSRTKACIGIKEMRVLDGARYQLQDLGIMVCKCHVMWLAR